MKNWILMAALTGSIFQVQVSLAQIDIDDAIDAELSRITGSNVSKTQSGVSAAGVGDSNPNFSNSNSSAPNIQINVQSSPLTKVSSQPQSETTLGVNQESRQIKDETIGVAGESLSVLKDARQRMEVENNSKVVEKLETSRLEDEKTRAERLLRQSQEVVNSSSENIVIEVRPSSQTISTEALPSEVKSVVESPVLEEKKSNQSIYYSGILGFSDYLGVENVRGLYSLGFSIGSQFEEKWSIEGAFLYSEFDVEQRDGAYFCDPYYYGSCSSFYPRMTRMDQYQLYSTLKYEFLKTSFRPYLGGIFSYSYRTFEDIQLGYYYNDAQSHALDLGLALGFSLKVSSNFSVGADYRRLWNLTHRSSNSQLQKSFAMAVYNSDKPIESLSQGQFSIMGRFEF